MKSFTLVEIVVALIIIGILATLGIPTYRNIVDDADARVCMANQDVLVRALEAYALEQDVLPGNLSLLRRADLYHAVASLLRERGAWRIKLAYCISSFAHRGLVYAETEPWVDRYVQDLNVLICPAQKKGGSTGRSYGMNALLIDKPLMVYRALPDTILVVADAKNALISGLGDLRADGSAHVHHGIGGKRNYAVGTCRGHAAFRIYSDGQIEHIKSSANAEYIPSTLGDMLDY